MKRPGRIRLDRALSKLGLASRTEAQTLIREGRVTVDGCPISEPSALVVPEADRIALDGQQAHARPWRTLLLHKPRGAVTTRRDPEGRRTVFDVLGDTARDLVAIGRLDMATTGLLLLTTDNRLANWLTDAVNRIPRRYIVTARGRVGEDRVRRMEEGIRGLRAETVQIRKRSARETHLTVVLTEGRNREIRRLFEAIGHEVTRLKRVAFGSIELGSLQPGQSREASRAEMARAFPGAHWLAR